MFRSIVLVLFSISSSVQAETLRGSDFADRVLGSGSPQNHRASPSCSYYPVCDDLGLEGECCPTADGIWLDCCSGGGHGTQPRECKLQSGCSDLVGNCCPTDDGVYLDCCSDGDHSSPDPPSTDKQCSARSACAHLGGDCCPTVDGVYLDCCHE